MVNFLFYLDSLSWISIPAHGHGIRPSTKTFGHWNQERLSQDVSPDYFIISSLFSLSLFKYYKQTLRVFHGEYGWDFNFKSWGCPRVKESACLP